MQELVDSLPVRAIGQRLFDQAAQAPQIALEPPQFQVRLMVLKARYGSSQADFFTEGRK